MSGEQQAVLVVLAAALAAGALLVRPARPLGGPRGVGLRHQDAAGEGAAVRPAAQGRARLGGGPARTGAASTGVVEALEVLTVLLRSGADPTTALNRLVTHLPLLVPSCRPEVAATLREVADVAALGGDVPRAWVGAARTTRDHRMLAAGAAWDVATRTGSSLAPVLDGVLAGARRDAEVDHDVTVALAGPQATARLLSLLPLGGPLLGWLMGVDVLGVLTGTTAGRVSAVAGLALALAGRTWTRRLVRRARPGALPSPAVGGGRDRGGRS